MIRHVVMFKFKPEVDKTARVDFAQKLSQLAQDIEVVRALEIGQNFAVSPRASDLVLIVDVDNEEALRVYGDHPKHQPVKQLSAQLCSESHVVDYVIED
jgi:hypothetical protein